MKKYFTIVTVAVVGALVGAAITTTILMHSVKRIASDCEEQTEKCVAIIEERNSTIIDLQRIVNEQKQTIDGQTACIKSLRSTVEKKNDELAGVMNHDWDRVEYDRDGQHYVHEKEDGILGKLGFSEVIISKVNY